MNNKIFINLLRAMEACDDAVYWCERHGGTLEELWRDCERGDWMWWLLMKTSMPTKEQSVKYARWCAKRASDYAADYAAYRAAYAAVTAADAAYRAAYAAARAAYFAAYAAYAAAAAAYAAAAYAAWDAERKSQAEYIRKHFTRPTLDKSKESK